MSQTKSPAQFSDPPRFQAPPAQFDLAMVPRPFVEGRDDWLATHDLAWQLTFAHISHDPNLASPWFMDEACMPDRLWQWDTCFMAINTAYAPHVFPGVQSLDNFYAWQRDDGFIAMCTLQATGQPAYGERINPPLMAWIEWDYYRMTGDDTRFARVLPHLVRYFDWIKANRRRPRIVRASEGRDPASCKDEGELYWATCAGAMGMDNSPRAAHLSWTGGEFAWIDLSSQQALAALYLKRIATHLGESQIATRFEEEYKALARAVNRWMWCERSQFYHDIFMDGNFLSCKTVAAFWPMLAEFASPTQADALLAHLRNPNEFWRPHPVPSLSADDPNYCESGGYWLGGVWAPTNHMIVRGLHLYGHDATAHQIARKHLEGITAVVDAVEPHTIWEAYAPEMTAPATTKNRVKFSRPDFCGWSGLGAMTMFYENIIGVHRDVPGRRLTWHIHIDEAHGFKRYPFPGGDVQLRCEAADASGTRTITIESPVAFTLELHHARRSATLNITPGRSSTVL